MLNINTCPNCGACPRVLPKPVNPVFCLAPNGWPKLLPVPNDVPNVLVAPRVLVPNAGAALPNAGAVLPNVGAPKAGVVPNVLVPNEVFPKPEDKQY